MNRLKNVLICSVFMVSTASYGLVDYSDEPRTPVSRKTETSTKKIFAKEAVKKRLRFPLSQFKANFSLGMEGVQREKKQNFWILESILQTPWDFFLETRYRKGEGAEQSGGSGRLLLGFNWLRFGGMGNRVGVDIFGSLGWGQKNSSLATSRRDKMFGLRTYKTLHHVSMEMGFEHYLTGRPEGGELSIGDIQAFSMALGWRVRPDIFLALEGGVVGISSDESGLKDKMDWEYLSPQLKLKFSSLVEVAFKADLRIKEAASPKAVQARLWDFPAACGNAMKASLSLTL